MLKRKQIFVLMACIIGLGAARFNMGMDSQILADTGVPTPAELPKGYDTLGGILGLEMKSSPKLFRSTTQYNAAKVDADLRGAIMTMKDIHSDNEDVNYVASVASDAFDDTAHTLEQVDADPLRADIDDGLPLSSLIQLAIHPYLSPIIAIDRIEKKNAAQAHLLEQARSKCDQLAGNMDKIQTAMLLLPKIAAKYSAALSPNDDHIKAIFLPAWGPFGPNDLIAMENTGPEIKNCTIVVDIQGAGGEAHENVHFIPDWPSHTPLLATYAHGQKIFGRMIGQLTFSQISAVTVTLLSPEYSTHLHCPCDPATRDQQIATICKNLNVTYHYTIHRGLLSTTREGDLTMDGVSMLPACTLDMTMHIGMKTRLYHIALSPWKSAERKTFPALTFPADAIDVVLTFPNTSYHYQTTLHPPS